MTISLRKVLPTPCSSTSLSPTNKSNQTSWAKRSEKSTKKPKRYTNESYIKYSGWQQIMAQQQVIPSIATIIPPRGVFLRSEAHTRHGFIGPMGYRYIICGGKVKADLDFPPWDMRALRILVLGGFSNSFSQTCNGQCPFSVGARKTGIQCELIYL